MQACRDWVLAPALQMCVFQANNACTHRPCNSVQSSISGMSYSIADHGSHAQVCCDLVPAFPDLPDERSATIEANIVNQNYTFVARHYFSQRLGAVSLAVFSALGEQPAGLFGSATLTT